MFTIFIPFFLTLLSRVLHLCLSAEVPCTCLYTIRHRDFPVASSWLWNTLPQNVTSVTSLRFFVGKRRKTYLFNHSFPQSTKASVYTVSAVTLDRTIDLFTYFLL